MGHFGLKTMNHTTHKENNAFSFFSFCLSQLLLWLLRNIHATGDADNCRPACWLLMVRISKTSTITMLITAIISMMTSSNWIIFPVTGPLWGESTGHRWIPFTKASGAALWTNNRDAGDLRRHGAHCDVTVPDIYVYPTFEWIALTWQGARMIVLETPSRVTCQYWPVCTLPYFTLNSHLRR